MSVKSGSLIALDSQRRSHVSAQEAKEAILCSEHRANGMRCLVCAFFKQRPYFISTCSLKKNKAVKPYNICGFFKEKEPKK